MTTEDDGSGAAIMRARDGLQFQLGFGQAKSVASLFGEIGFGRVYLEVILVVIET